MRVIPLAARGMKTGRDGVTGDDNTGVAEEEKHGIGVQGKRHSSSPPSRRERGAFVFSRTEHADVYGNPAMQTVLRGRGEWEDDREGGCETARRAKDGNLMSELYHGEKRSIPHYRTKRAVFENSETAMTTPEYKPDAKPSNDHQTRLHRRRSTIHPSRAHWNTCQRNGYGDRRGPARSSQCHVSKEKDNI